MIPLLFLGQAQSNRQSRAPAIVSAVLLTTVVRVAPMFLPVQTSLIAEIADYLFPVILTLVAIWLFLAGVQLRPPDAIVAFGEGLFARASGLAARRAPAPASQ
jgi:hypothetical protein